MAGTSNKLAITRRPRFADRAVVASRPLSGSDAVSPTLPERGFLSMGEEGGVDRSAFLEAMRKAVATVGIVSTDGPGGRFGLTVSSMSSLSVEPPSMLVCIHRNSPVIAAVAHNRAFCINSLGEGQEHVSEVFAGRHPAANADRFSCAEWTTIITGSPALSKAAASLDCRLADQHQVSSHVLLIGTVVGVLINGCRVLLYHDRQYRRLNWGL
jgi:flavin reductase (DIM6/NTAB) family NADH-FMN oxidoreductase RutF